MKARHLKGFLGFPGLAALAALTASAPAFGEGGGGLPPPWHALPEGHMSEPPEASATPATIPARQKAEGFWVVRPQWTKTNKNDFLSVSVTTSAATAKSEETGQYDGSTPDTSTCVTSPELGGVPDGDSAVPIAWSPLLRVTNPLTWQPNANQAVTSALRVQAVHLERLKDGPDGGAVLEYADAFVDIGSLGGRLIGRGAIPLARVATAPGIVVFAAREGATVHFVVRAGSPSDSSEASQQTRRLTTIRQPFTFGQTECGFARLGLRAPTGGGETATVVANVPLPPLPSTRAGMGRIGRLLIRLSASRSASDPEPLLSVTSEWMRPEDQVVIGTPED
jgi:hypothetical protein